MSEIVDALRKADYDTPYVWDLTAEAASHIEALEKRVEKLELEKDRMKFVILTAYKEWDMSMVRDAARSILSQAKGEGE